MINIFEIKGYVTYDDTKLHLDNLNNQFFAYQIENTMFFKNFRIYKTGHSSDRSLQLDSVKLESLVIGYQP